jgi:RNA polymerase sigma-70 factor (ECF subfamily)
MRAVDPLAEDELVARLLARDEDALRTAIDRFGPLVLATARRVVNERSLAEEVAQDTFVALWRRPGAYDSERGSLRAFLLGVARNKAVDLVRRERARRRTVETLLAEAAPASAGVPTDESIADVDARDQVLTALDKLSVVQREAILLAYFGGRTYREVARELDIPEGTAKTRLRDGLTRLRELIAGPDERR